MKSVLLGCASAVLIAVAAWAVLNPAQRSANVVYATEGVRLTPTN